MNERVRWTHVTIALAVVAAVAIGAPAIGGQSATTAVKKKALKKLVKKEVAKQIRKKTGPPGITGATGAAGTPATALWAVIDANGSGATINRGSGAVSADRQGVGNYRVFFNRNIMNCAYVASQGPTGSTGATNGEVGANLTSGTTAIQVRYFNSAGAAADTPLNHGIHVAVFCP